MTSIRSSLQTEDHGFILKLIYLIVGSSLFPTDLNFS